MTEVKLHYELKYCVEMLTGDGKIILESIWFNSENKARSFTKKFDIDECYQLRIEVIEVVKNEFGYEIGYNHKRYIYLK